MEKLTVTIDWCEKNYSASLVKDEIGVIVATAKTESVVKEKFKESLQFHIEGMVADNDEVPQYLANGEYEICYQT